MFIDTHCHIHDKSFYSLEDQELLYRRAIDCDVRKIICVGTDLLSSMQSIQFSTNHEGVFSAVGIYPTENDDVTALNRLADSAKVVAIGEIGLDYHERDIDKAAQRYLLEAQLQLAKDKKLPVSFHVRDAFDDFWPILNNFSDIRGVLHSFTDSSKNMEKALSLGLFIGVNGISTFTKSESQIAMFNAIPLSNILFETDAPFLTPVPYRGKINEPAFVRYIVHNMAKQRNVEINYLADIASNNSHRLFGL